MLNKLICCIVVFFCLCIQVFAQDVKIQQTEAGNFVEQIYWYHKYLPLEDVPAYDVLRQRLIEANSADEFDKISNELAPYIHHLNNRLFRQLKLEISRRDEKIDKLTIQYNSNEKVDDLSGQYTIFNDEIDTAGKSPHSYPENDVCLGNIDNLYSELITRSRYGNNRNRYPWTGTYTVEKGDYLRRIAEKFYGHEMLWERIWKDDMNYRNKSFLPDPQNPDFIYPNAEIRIPR